MHKLDEAGAQNCGVQVLQVLEAIQARHGWSNGDLIAVCMVVATEIIARSVGPTRTAEFFRWHGDAIAAEHAKRATT